MNNKSIKKNTVFNLIKTVSSIIFPLISFPYITRVLHAENVGKYNFSASVVSYFSLIASLGISTYAIRECSAVRDDKNKLSQVASQIFTINLASSLISYVFLFIALIFYRKLDNYRTIIIIQSLSIIFGTLGTDWLNTAMEDFRYITIRSASFQIISIVLMFLFVKKPDDYMRYVCIGLLSTSGASILNIWYRRRYCIVRITTNTEFKKHLKPIIFMFVMLLAQNIFNNVDTTMLGLMYGDKEVGVYSAAHKISNIISQMVASILWVIIPRMSYYFEQGDFTEINVLLKKILGFNSLIGLPCAIGTIMIARDIIFISAGDEFLTATPVLQILMISFIITLIGGNFLGNAILLPSKQEKYYMIVCCITAVINVITNWIFIPKFGAKAAAATTAFCSFVILLLTYIKKDKRIIIRKMLGTTVSPLLGSVLIVVICLASYSINNLIVRVSVSILGSAVAYGIIQLLFRNELLFDVIMPILRKIKR